LGGRDLLIELRALGLVSVHVGVRLTRELEFHVRTVSRPAWG
jgi:hypothetical protein